MNKLSCTIGTYIFILFTSIINAQYVELTGKNSLDLQSHVHFFEDGSIVTISGTTLKVGPSYDCSDNEIKSLEFKDLKDLEVKWATKDAYFELLGSYIDGNTIKTLGAVRELKTDRRITLNYTFDKNLKLLDEKIVQIIDKPSEFMGFTKNKENLSFVIYEYFYAPKDKKMEEFTNEIKCHHFNSNLEFTETNTFKLPDLIRKNGKIPEIYTEAFKIINSTNLLEDGTIIFNVQEQLYVGFLGESEAQHLNLNNDQNLSSYKFYEGRKNNGLTLIGAYYNENETGLVVLDIDKDLTTKEQFYYPFHPDFTTQFYDLSNRISKNPRKGDEDYDNFDSIRPILEEAIIEEDGSIRAVFMGWAYSKTNRFRSNLINIAITDGDIQYQNIVPYIYKEDAYISYGSTEVCVFFKENCTVICYPDYQQNYNELYEFVPTTSKIPYANKPLYSAIKFDHEQNKTFHKLLEVKASGSIKYSPNASYLWVTYTELKDGSILIKMDEYGFASIKASYTGRLIFD